MRKYILLLLLGSLLLTSCEDFLDLQPESEIGEGIFFKNQEEIENVLVGCYTSLQETVEHEWVLTEFRSDNTLYNPNFSSGREATMFALDLFTLTSENEYVDAFYTAAYSSIGAINIVLDNTEVVEDSIQKQHIEGQARFMRAYQYFNLVRLYGPVFLSTSKLTSEEANNMVRAPEEEVYDMIITDLDFAATHIKDDLFTEDNAGRATSWAAKALLAKVYLTLDNYEESKTLLDDIMTNSPYYLLGDYEDVFDPNNEMNDEIIFAIRFSSNSGGLGNELSTLFAPVGVEDVVVTGTGEGYNYPPTELLDAYSPADSRKAASVYDPADASTHEGIEEELNINFVKKYIAEQLVDYDSDADFIVLRYADVLLMYAEALVETDGFGAAIPYLNQIRTRAQLSSVYPDSDHQFRLALEYERRLEFTFENHRWYDLKRTGRVNEVMSAHFIKASEYALIAGDFILPEEILPWQELLPIPQSQIDINPDFSQNYGY